MNQDQDAILDDHAKRGGKRFYIYTHARPDGTVFYVGKGVGDRARDFWRRSEYHKRVCNKIGRKNVLVSVYPVIDERHAFEAERMLIFAIRRAGIHLVNHDNGGSGRLGVSIGPEHRERIRQSLLGHPVSEETRRKIGAAGIGRKPSIATRAKLSKKKLSESHKLALLKATIGRVVSEEQKEKARQKMKGRVLSDEHREKLRIAHLGKKPSAETIAKRSVSLREAWARRKERSRQNEA